MNHPGKFRSILATARIANVPSVVSNVWAGSALAIYLSFANFHGSWMNAAVLSLAGVLLYLSGNFFNDWKDRDWDAENRPERALPRGLFSATLYLWIGLACALTGCFLAFSISLWSGIIALSILSLIAAYTHWHKEAAWAVIPMGLCRALLPLMGMFPIITLTSPDATLILTHAAALFLYIAGLSVSARGEARATATSKPPFLGKIMLALAGSVAASYWLFRFHEVAWIATLPFFVWILLALTFFRRPISAHVSSLLAGIPLLDAIPLLTIASLTALARGTRLFSDPFAATCLIVPLAAFALGRRLQRIAPAT